MPDKGKDILRSSWCVRPPTLDVSISIDAPPWDPEKARLDVSASLASSSSESPLIGVTMSLFYKVDGNCSKEQCLWRVYGPADVKGHWICIEHNISKIFAWGNIDKHFVIVLNATPLNEKSWRVLETFLNKFPMVSVYVITGLLMLMCAQNTRFVGTLHYFE